MQFTNDIMTLQMVLASSNYYKGAIDGVLNDKTFDAIDIIGNNRGGWPEEWHSIRKLIASAQVVLSAQGYFVGDVDGFAGPSTVEALHEFSSALVGTDSSVTRVVKTKYDRDDLPSQAECAEFYGTPGSEVQSQLVYIKPPYKMVLDWDLETAVSRIRVHEKCAEQLETALTEVGKKYSKKEIKDLGLNRFAGAYTHRKMRGGSSWSMHAYGCAIDIYAAPNALRMSCPQALFCGEEYKPFLDIMENNGWLPAIRLWGRDAMHFQMATM